MPVAMEDGPMIGRVKSGPELACASTANRRLGFASILALAIAAVAAMSIPPSLHPAVAAAVNAHGAPHRHRVWFRLLHLLRRLCGDQQSCGRERSEFRDHHG